LRKFSNVLLPYVILMVLLIGLAHLPGYKYAAQTGPSSDDCYYYNYNYYCAAPVPITETCSDDLQIAASYDGNVHYLRFDGWGFTPSGMIRGYIDGKPTWDSGLVAPDGYVWGLIFVSLSPGQHSVYLVDLSTGKRSCTVTIVA